MKPEAKQQLLKDRRDYRQTLIQRAAENEKKLKEVEEQIRELSK